MIETLKNNLEASIAIKQQILDDDTLIQNVNDVSICLIKAFKADKKVFFCGNGGSAADAQHIAAELSGRYYYDRDPLYAEALHVNTSYLTAVANDYSYDEIYSRMIKAACDKGDVLVALSTSGNSKNIIRALEQAKAQNMIIIGFSNEDGGKMNGLCDILIKIPSKDTPRVQECHMLLLHSVCEDVELAMFPK